jgi:hypothetical protein
LLPSFADCDAEKTRSAELESVIINALAIYIPPWVIRCRAFCPPPTSVFDKTCAP